MTDESPEQIFCGAKYHLGNDDYYCTEPSEHISMFHKSPIRSGGVEAMIIWIDIEACSGLDEIKKKYGKKGKANKSEADPTQVEEGTPVG